MSESDPVFRAHMLLLRWGEERLARQAQEMKKPSDEAANDEQVSTSQDDKTAADGA
jgi:hypothetical protein